MKKVILSLFSFVSALSLVAQTPYARYPFDGNANDVSGNNLNGTTNGSPVAAANRNNQAGSCLSFNGSTDYVSLPEDFDFVNRTIIVWFNASQIPSGNNGGVVYNSDHSNINNGLTYILVKNDGVANVIQMGMDGALYYSSMNTNQWYQVAMVRSASSVKFYVNGTEVFTSPNPDGTHSVNGVSYAVVGADRGFNSKFIGKIDDLSIYNAALSETAITNNYTSIRNERMIDEKTSVTVQGNNVVVQLKPEIVSEMQNVELFDLNGKLIASVKPVNEQVVFNNLPLAKGTYIVRFTHATAVTLSKKLVF